MSDAPSAGRTSRGVSLAIVGAAATALVTGAALIMRAEARTNKVALADRARPVSIVRAKQATFREFRTYVGTLHPWVEANVGPQFVSAYVDTVLVRPGAQVRRGEVLATLDCRNASSAQTAIAMQARAIEAREGALVDEANRTRKLLDGGFASANEVEQALAQSASTTAQLASQRASMARGLLEVRDCVLRAPFDGEVGDRFADPGSFARPGTAIVSVLDRATARFAADVPEVDFGVVTPGARVRIHVDATGQDIEGVIARRAPHADLDSRTVHFEVDVPNPKKDIPVDTTGEVRIEFGKEAPAVELPLYAATVRGARATVFVVEADHAHARTLAVLGELGDRLLLDPGLAPGSAVVAEGRALLNDGDLVAAREETEVAR
jgi:membrane fusion protein (multidrug efflux system)